MLPAPRIFITENEINGLAFPNLPDSIVIFGLGYALDRLAAASWMADRTIHYWDDIALFIIGVILTLTGSRCSIGSVHIFHAPVHC
jgi:hypothetical protein